MNPWNVLAESVAGTSHRASGQPCQDAFRHARCGPDESVLVVAVADGAGSAAFADVGASLACDALICAILARIQPTPREGEAPAEPHAPGSAGASPSQEGSRYTPAAQFTREVFVEVLTAARTALVSEAVKRDCSLRDLACTVLLAVVDPDAAAFAQLGDGAIVIAREDRYEPVFWPQEGEYANTTNFLTDDNFAAALECGTRSEQVREFALFSDGLQRLALDYAGRTGHVGFFRPLFQRLRTATKLDELQEPFRQFLDSPRINGRTDDDKTLVLATRQTPDEAPAETR